jgi:hypothetical protein
VQENNAMLQREHGRRVMQENRMRIAPLFILKLA